QQRQNWPLWMLLLSLMAGVASAAPTAPPEVFRLFAMQVERAAAAGDARFIDGRVDVAGLAAIISMGYEDAGRTNDRLRQQLGQRLDWGQAITQAVTAGGHYRLL